QKLKQVLSQSKIDRMASDIRNAVAQEQKIIVFSQYTETIRRLSESLRQKPVGGDPIRCVTLTGADDMEERQKAVDAFQNKNQAEVFIANIKAGGVGLTLTSASIVMFADMEWSPEIHNQAEDRAHRIGQEGTVNVYYYVVADTIENDIINILNEKKNVMDQVLEGKKPSKKSESMQEAFLKLMAKKVIHREG
ncbi:MAG: helicase-related protein, partial [Undibacterium sp.]